MKTIEFIEETEELAENLEELFTEQEFREIALGKLFSLDNRLDTIRKTLMFFHLSVSIIGFCLAILLSVLINSI